MEDAPKRDAIVKRLGILAKAATSHQEAPQIDSLLAQNTIPVDVDKVGYFVSFIRTTMKWTKDGKAHVMKSNLTFYHMHLDFSTQAWQDGMYRPIGTRQCTDDHSWLDSINTEQGENPRKLCIEAA